MVKFPPKEGSCHEDPQWQKPFNTLFIFLTEGQRAFPWTSKSQGAFQQHPTLEDQFQTICP